MKIDKANKITKTTLRTDIEGQKERVEFANGLTVIFHKQVSQAYLDSDKYTRMQQNRLDVLAILERDEKIAQRIKDMAIRELKKEGKL